MAEGNESQYILNNENEISRLTNQHAVIKDAMEGKLLLAPVNVKAKPLKILDSATADGLWMRDIATTAAAGTTFIGTDLNPHFFPKTETSGITFQMQDINQPWPAEFADSFDIVHQRLALATSPDKAAVIKQLVWLVKPGGWIQVIEGENVAEPNDGPAMKDFIQILKDVFSTMGADPQFPRHIKGWLEQAGCVDVQDAVVPCAMGANNKKSELVPKGLASMKTAVTEMVGFASQMPPLPNLSKVQVDTLTSRLNAELEELGGIFPLRVVWGCKPVLTKEGIKDEKR